MDRQRGAFVWGRPVVNAPGMLALLALIVVAIIVGATGSAIAFWDSTIGTSGRLTVASAALSAKADHQVVVDGSYVHAVWVSGTTVYYKRSSDGGHTWSTPAGYTNRTTIAGTAPAVAAANGHVLITYIGGASPYDIYTVASDDNGDTWGAQTSRATGNTGIAGAGTIDNTFADAVLTSTGASTAKGFLVYRTSGPGIGGTAGTFVIPVSLSGSTWTYSAAVNAYTSSPAGAPRIAASTTNAFMMWVPTSGNAAMYRSTNAGWTTWGVTAAPPGLTGAQGIAAQDGVAYEAYTTAGGTYVATYTNATNTWGSGVLAVTGASPSEAAIACSGTRLEVVAAYPSGSGIAPASRMSTDGGSNWRLQKTLPTPAGSTYTLNLASAAGSDSALYSDGTSLFYSGWAVDITAPTVPVVTAMPANTSSIQLTWPASTDGSPSSDGIYYSVYTSGGSLVTTTSSTGLTVADLDPDTSYGFYVTASDDDGNTSSNSSTAWATTDALSTIPSPSPVAPDGSAGWYSSEPTVTLAFNAAGTTYYGWDSTASPVVYSGAITALQGDHTLYYRSVDTSGHAEAWNSMPIKVDTVAPTASTLTGSATGTSTADLSWSGATDGASGIVGYMVFDADTSAEVASTTASTASLSGLTPDTTYHFVVRAIDEAGNVSADSNTLTVTTEALDTTAPTTTRSVTPASADGSNGWYVTAPVVTLSANEPGTTYYAIDGGTTSTYASSVTMAQGTHTIAYHSVDVATNVEATQSVTFKVDTSAPSAATLTGSATGPSTASLSWSGAADAVSGIVGYKVYDTDTSSQVASTTASATSLTGLTPGATYHFKVKTIDEAGNVSADSNTLTVTTEALDTTAPTTTRSVTPASADGSNGWYVTAPVVGLSADEPGTTYYALDGGATATYASPITIAEGTHTIAYSSVDIAANRETTQSATFKVDTSAPSAPTLTGSATGASTASLSWSGATDAVSGIASYRVYDADTSAQVASTSGSTASLTGLTPSTTRHFNVKSVDAAGRLSGSSNSVTITLDSLGNVTPGTAEVTADDVLFRFTSVTTTGSASAYSYAPQRPAPSNFRFIGGSYYNIHVTSGIFSGPVRVVVHYNPADVQGDPNDLRLFHWNGSAWEDITVPGSVDTGANTIEGETTSFSDFSVSEPLASSSSTTPASSTWSLALIGILAMGILVVRARRVEREA